MATVGYVFLRNRDQWCFGLTTYAGVDLWPFFAHVGPHVPEDPQEAFRAYLAWREHVVPRRERLRHPSAYEEGFPFEWSPTEELASSPETLLSAVREEAAARVAEATAPEEADAYRVGYGHASTTLLVDLVEREAWLEDLGGEVRAVVASATYMLEASRTGHLRGAYPPLTEDGYGPPPPRPDEKARALFRDHSMPWGDPPAPQEAGPPVRYGVGPGTIGVVVGSGLELEEEDSGPMKGE